MPSGAPCQLAAPEARVTNVRLPIPPTIFFEFFAAGSRSTRWFPWLSRGKIGQFGAAGSGDAEAGRRRTSAAARAMRRGGASRRRSASADRPDGYPSAARFRQDDALDHGSTPWFANGSGSREPGSTITPSRRVADPAGVADRVAVRAERAAVGLDLLDAPVPEVAAVVDDVVVRRAPRSGAGCRSGGAWRARAAPGARRRRRRRWSRNRRSTGRCRRRPRPGLLVGRVGREQPAVASAWSSRRPSARTATAARRARRSSTSHARRVTVARTADGRRYCHDRVAEGADLGGHLLGRRRARRRSPRAGSAARRRAPPRARRGGRTGRSATIPQ